MGTYNFKKTFNLGHNPKGPVIGRKDELRKFSKDPRWKGMDLTTGIRATRRNCSEKSIMTPKEYKDRCPAAVIQLDTSTLQSVPTHSKSH
jgi:hypothetical protein